MVSGIYTSASAFQAADARQQVLAASLANADTPGYKSNDITAQSFQDTLASLYDPLVPGTGVEPAGDRFDLSQGGFAQTGNPLDAALDGDGFFALQGPTGTLYTRAGRFSRDAQGVLRSIDGLAVLGADGQPITATGADVRIQQDGTVLSDGAGVGRLQVVTLDPAALARAGTSAFTSSGAAGPSTARVVSGSLENSNVDVTAVMTAMTMLLRALEAGQQAVQLQNDAVGSAVNQVGAVH